MKKIYQNSIFLLLAFFLGSNSIVLGTEYRTRQSLVWSDGDTKDWDTNIWERVQGQNWEDHTGSPTVNNNDKITIGWSILTGHHVVKSEDLDVKNQVSIEIFSGNSLRIIGNLNVDNSFTVVVHQGAKFIVDGNVVINANNTAQAAELVINGTAEIGGNLSGYGNVTGNGTILVEGEIDRSKVNIGDGISLPIELLDFTAKAGSQGVTITWITAAEINNDYFTIERSTDGNNWEILSYVQGAGNSNNVLTYYHEDLNPLQGISYYRLKQTDFDGQFEYFSPVAVQFNSASAKSEIIGVNTLGQQIELVISTGNQNAHLIIADIQGRIIHRQLLNGNDSVEQISVNLPRSYSGSVVVVRLADNQNTDERKIRVF